MHRMNRKVSKTESVSIWRWYRWQTRWSTLLFFGIILGGQIAWGRLESGWRQDVSVVSRGTTSGTVQSIRRGQLVLLDENGARQAFKFQQGATGLIGVDGGRAIINAPATIRVHGSMPTSVLQPGAVIQTSVELNRAGKCSNPVAEMRLVDLDTSLSVLVENPNEATAVSNNNPFTAKLVARVVASSRNSIQVEIPENNWISKTKIQLPVDGQSSVLISEDDLYFVQSNDIVTMCRFGELTTGDRIVIEIEVELLPRATLVSGSLDKRLQLQFAQFSNESHAKPRVERSKNFLLQTDISDRRAQILLAKLETMVELIGAYYRSPPKQLIECYVIEDLDRWPANQFDEDVRTVISAREGFTVTAIRGNDRKSIVYSHADDTIVQHEAVHAYCAQTFGATGPYWYAEGMAELGKYWKPDVRHVTVHSAVIEYLRVGEPMALERLISDQRVVAVGWQDYAWRWAVCHFLANNPNYATRFKTLGFNLMSPQREDSFAAAFHEQAHELRFEFEFFIKHLQNGLRVDLIAWNWDKKPKTIAGSRTNKCKVQADSGWQPSGLTVDADRRYHVKSSGRWQTGVDSPSVDADGAPDGNGQLMGVIFDNFRLSEPFELGTDCEVTFPASGHLLLRCKDDWAELDDNQGELNVEIGLAK